MCINHLKDPKDFIEYSNDMNNVYKNTDNYNPDKENKILMGFYWYDCLYDWY